MRPFEVGDLVVSENYGVGTVETIRADFIECDKFSDDCNQHFYNSDGNEIVLHIEKRPICEITNTIKTIRTPRKGSKEARDIVAMLGWDIHNSRLSLKRYFKRKNLKRTFREINAHHNETAIKIAIFEKAKSMLK